MEEVKSLGYQDRPSYEKLRSILWAGLKAIQAKDDGKLEFILVNEAISPLIQVNPCTHTELYFIYFFSIITILVWNNYIASQCCYFLVFQKDHYLAISSHLATLLLDFSPPYDSVLHLASLLLNCTCQWVVNVCCGVRHT